MQQASQAKADIASCVLRKNERLVYKWAAFAFDFSYKEKHDGALGMLEFVALMGISCCKGQLHKQGSLASCTVVVKAPQTVVCTLSWYTHVLLGLLCR